jgi:ubiquinone/menaquinone biosynthesis C-methylase UbiE
MPPSPPTPRIAPEDEEFAALLLDTAEFDRSEKGYAGFIKFNLSAVERGERVVARVERQRPVAGSTVLDIGAGTGGLAIAFAKAGATTWALEPDRQRREWLHARARGHGARVRVITGVAEQLDFADESIDVVILDSVIEHVESPAAAIREASRVLRRHGLIYLVSPNKWSLLNILKDPHYQMVGVVLMPRWLGRLYVERIRRSRRAYWVNVIPAHRWLRREFARGGVTLSRQPPAGWEKLRDPARIRDHRIRSLARLFGLVGATAVLERLAIAQNPVHIFVGIKNVAAPTDEGGDGCLQPVVGESH